ncbi:MAG: hypothetical protein ACM3XM_20590 [Mycobacterium leprae]
MRTDKVVFFDRSKASRVEVLEYAAELERSEQLSELLLIVRDVSGNYSFLGASDEVLRDPARIVGQLELLKQVILGQAFA